MSLINDALKKAQKDQSRFSSSNLGPAIPPGYVPSSSAKSDSSPFKTVLIYILGSASLICISVFITLHLIKEPEQSIAAKPVASNAPAQPPTPDHPPEATSSASATPPPATAAPAIKVRAPAPLTLPESANQPVPEPLVKQPALATFNPVPTPVTLQVVPSQPAPTPLAPIVLTAPSQPTTTPVVTPQSAISTQRIQAIVDRIQINSVRTSQTETKVIINNRLYRLGDTIDHSIGLRLSEVHHNHILFTDEVGNKYIKLR